MQFNPQDYENVKSRKEKFYKEYADGRITVKFISTEPLEYAMFEARVYMTAEDQKNDCPRGVGYSLEIRDKVKQINKYGKEYESVNYTSWTENCEESAVGRALDNAGFSGNKKASLEEMEKMNRMSETIATSSPKPATAPKEEEDYDATENALCRVHSNPDGSAVVMKHYQNEKGEWWSHKLPNGTWCNGRNTVGNKNL